MIAATEPSRHADARLLVVRADASGEQIGSARIDHRRRSALPDLLQHGDLLVANDAATLPASLTGTHLPTDRAIEVRLAGRPTLDPTRIDAFTAVVFGAGDFRMRTEDRPQPPHLSAGDRLALGPLRATVTSPLNHPRLISLRFDGVPREIWKGLAQHGKPIQYSHLGTQLGLWDVWTPLAGSPVAFEPPSAGFALSWDMLRSFAERGVRVATLTHAAGLSSTGDPALDARLPLDEVYRIPFSTSKAIAQTQRSQGRVIAIGTTVVRALEHAASRDGVVPAGERLATQRIGAGSRLRVVDALLSGTHESGSSHHELLRAFVDDVTLKRIDKGLERHGYRTHEFGDFVFVENLRRLRCLLTYSTRQTA